MDVRKRMREMFPQEIELAEQNFARLYGEPVPNAVQPPPPEKKVRKYQKSSDGSKVSKPPPVLLPPPEVDGLEVGWSHIVVLDFEATCCDVSGRSYPNEIIEFPSVLLDRSGKVLDEFQVYVKPVKNP